MVVGLLVDALGVVRKDDRRVGEGRFDEGRHQLVVRPDILH